MAPGAQWSVRGVGEELGLNGDVMETAMPKARGAWLALACIALWLAAAAGARLLGIWLAIGGTSVALGFTVLAVDRATARRFLRPNPELILLGAAAGGFMAAATYLVYPALSRLFPFVVTDTARLYAEFRAPSLLIASVALAPIVLGEELVWRGAVQTSLAQRLGPRGGVVLSAVAYGLAHAPLGSALLVAVALLCGLAWGGLRATTASLIPALVAHLVWDVLVLFWLPLDSR